MIFPEQDYGIIAIPGLSNREAPMVSAPLRVCPFENGLRTSSGSKFGSPKTNAGRNEEQNESDCIIGRKKVKKQEK